MEQVTVYMIHKQYQEKVSEILLTLFDGVTKPLVVFGKNVNALQIESDLFITTTTASTAHIDILREIKKGIESNAPESKVPESKAPESKEPLLIGVYTTTMHSYSPMSENQAYLIYGGTARRYIDYDPFKEVDTISVVMNEVIKSENGVYSYPREGSLYIWKCKSLFAFRYMGHLKVFADPCTLANSIYTHMRISSIISPSRRNPSAVPDEKQKKQEKLEMLQKQQKLKSNRKHQFFIID